MVTFVLQRTFCVLLLQIFRKNSLYDYPLVSFLHTFQCKEDTFMYFWVSKLLEIFFLFDLFWVPIPGLTIHPRACIVLHVSLIGRLEHVSPNPSDHRDHPGTLGLLLWKLHFTTLIISTLILESFTRSQSIDPQSQIRVIQLPFVTNSTSGQQ